MIRTKRDLGSEQTTTEIETHRVKLNSGQGVGAVEFIIEQHTYRPAAKRQYAPRKLVLFVLSPDDAEALARQVLDHARQARVP